MEKRFMNDILKFAYSCLRRDYGLDERDEYLILIGRARTYGFHDLALEYLDKLTQLKTENQRRKNEGAEIIEIITEPGPVITKTTGPGLIHMGAAA